MIEISESVNSFTLKKTFFFKKKKVTFLLTVVGQTSYLEISSLGIAGSQTKQSALHCGDKDLTDNFQREESFWLSFGGRWL